MTKQQTVKVTSFKGVPDSEWSEDFLNGMVNRMAMSYFKYGLVADAYPHRVNAIESLLQRVKLYLEGDEAKGIKAGNTEYLMDAANFAMIEFMHPKQADAGFKATDSTGSPGRVWNSGAKSAKRNNHEVEELRRKFSKQEGD